MKEAAPNPEGDVRDGANDALNRMHRAAQRGTGCHLTADMIQSLAVSMVGQMWNEADPREENS